MKEQLLERIICPCCGGALELCAWERHGPEVSEGLLDCGCGESYPIIKCVPRLLVDESRGQLYEDYREFFAHNAHRLPSRLSHGVTHSKSIGRKTQQSFGFEWTTFSEVRPEWEKNFWGYMKPLDYSFFEGKTVLDAGCGMGRHLLYASQHCEEAMGVDFSRAVDAAFLNTRDASNSHVIQADLLRLPFAEQTFDFVYSLGVLHHIPQSDEALQSLVERLAPGGEVRIYLYWDVQLAAVWKKALLTLVNATRQITTRLPHRLLSAICYPIAGTAWLTFVLPYKCLSSNRFTAHWAESLPLTQYAQYPFGVIVNDQFDRFSAPLEKRFSSDQVRAFLAKPGLDDITVTAHWGWLGHAKRSAWSCPQESTRLSTGHMQAES